MDLNEAELRLLLKHNLEVAKNTDGIEQLDNQIRRFNEFYGLLKETPAFGEFWANRLASMTIGELQNLKEDQLPVIGIDREYEWGMPQ